MVFSPSEASPPVEDQATAAQRAKVEAHNDRIVATFNSVSLCPSLSFSVAPALSPVPLAAPLHLHLFEKANQLYSSIVYLHFTPRTNCGFWVADDCGFRLKNGNTLKQGLAGRVLFFACLDVSPEMRRTRSPAPFATDLKAFHRVRFTAQRVLSAC